jgi:type II secretory ATPase GspE/PulE/Tfp pilus assembly ATPase PilB-like protein
MENAIYEGKPETELEKLLPNQGFVNLRQDGIIKALLGYVTLEEILKIT